MNQFAFVGLALLLGGCAGPAPDSTTAATAITCTRETPTGSNLSVTRCRSKEEVERDAEAARETRDAIDRARSGLRGPGG